MLASGQDLCVIFLGQTIGSSRLDLAGQTEASCPLHTRLGAQPCTAVEKGVAVKDSASLASHTVPAFRIPSQAIPTWRPLHGAYA